MKHLFRATKIGWEKEKEGVWFCLLYTSDAADEL